MTNRREVVGIWLTILKTIPHPNYIPDHSLGEFWLFLTLEENLRMGRFVDIEKMKADVTRILDTVTLDGFNGLFSDWLN